MPPTGPIPMGLGAMAAYAVGMFSGAYELMAFQRKSQKSVFTTGYGLLYMTGNGLLSFAVYMAMNYIPGLFPAKARDHHLLQVVFAGTGSMAFIRTKYFGISQLIDGVREFIRERIAGVVAEETWATIENALSGVRSEEEFALTLKTLEEFSHLILYGETRAKFDAEIATARTSKDSKEGYTFTARSVLRTMVDLCGVGPVSFIVRQLDTTLVAYRQQMGVKEEKGPLFAPKTTFFRLVRDGKELEIVLSGLESSLDGAHPVAPEIATKIKEAIAKARTEEGQTMGDRRPVHVRLDEVVDVYIEEAGMRRLKEKVEVIEAAVLKARS